MLKITVENRVGGKWLALSGKLKGVWVLELERCWQESVNTPGELVVDLSEVDYVDRAGRYLLALMHESGARLQGGNPLTAEIVSRLTASRRKIPSAALHALLAGICLFTAPSQTPAQDTVRLDLVQTVVLARGQSLQVRAAKQGAATEKFTVDQAKALRYGKVQVNAGYLRLDAPISITSDPVHVPILGGLTLAAPPVLIAPADYAHVRLEAGIPLFTGGKITHAIAAARAGREAAEELSEDTEASAVLEASQLYLGALLARDVVLLHQQALDSYRRHLEDARTAYRTGVVANYDVVRAEAALAEQEKRLVEARNRSDLVEAALRTSLDLPPDTRLELQGTLFEPPLPEPMAELQSQADRSNRGLQAARKKVEALERATCMERGEYLPQVLAVAGKETVTSKLAQTDPNWFVGVQATWILFDGGARRARIRARASEAEQARIEERRVTEQIDLALRSALLEYESQKSARASAQKAADLALESLRLATRRFSVGAGTSLEVLDANVALTAAETGVRNAQYLMDTAYLRIHRYVGDIADIAPKLQ